MPSNEQRRAAAKKKLERQLANRATKARKRKQLTIAASALGVAVAVAAGVGIYFLTRGDDASTAKASESPDASLTAAPPPAAKPKPAAVSCEYRPATRPADKPVSAPGTANISTAGTPKVTMNTNQGAIGITLNPGESPCTVNSFESLIKQKFFDNTSCHRLTTSKGLQVLQCGDPTGTGMGGPGYQFDNEYPTDQYAPTDQAAQYPVAYKRGVIAMANAGPDQTDGKGTNGSQFFLVYGDSQLPPQYTIFGTIDDGGLATLDKIAKAGVTGGSGDGKPTADVNIQSVQIN